MHVHLPKGWQAADKRPAIVFFFGGGWRAGSVTQFEKQAEYLAERGLVAARADYRVLSRHKTTPDKCVEDAKSAVRWLRQHAAELGIDRERIVASGGSAGGHIAACAATIDGLEPAGEDISISSKPNLLILFNPALDLTTVGREVTNAAGENIARAISPCHFVKKETVPTIIFFGTSDRLIDGAQVWLKKAKETGSKAELFTAADQPHGFFNRAPWMEATLAQADEFLVAQGYLKGKPTVKVPEGATLNLAGE
jgi:acetyl esterase/lipase